MKKVLLFGGGTTSSQILKGLRQFPLELSAVIGVADSGRSTGMLREEFDIPAVGDITKVMVSMSNSSEDIMKLMNYKFDEDTAIGAHSIKNLIFTALIEMKGSIDASIPVFCDLLDINGTVMPITEDNVNLIATTSDGETIFGEDDITEAKKTIKSIKYDKDFEVNPKVFKSIEKADLIVISAGSLYTSIIPHLMIESVSKAIRESKAKVLYVCNLVTQPGETENLAASDHIKLLEKYLGKGTIDAIVVNSGRITRQLSKKYETREQKYPVKFDKKELEQLGLTIIDDKIYTIENSVIRHDSLKTAFLIFSYLMGRY